MRKLTQEEKLFYEENGYVVLENFFPIEEMVAMNEEIDRLNGERPAGGKVADHAGYMFELALLSPKTGQFASDERILDVLEDVVYPGISIYSSKLVEKLPYSETVCHWHQDDAYYHKVGDSQVRMSIWVPLTDARLDNGCLWVVPGSHKQGLQPFKAKEDGTCRLALAEEVDLSAAVPLEVKAGSLVLFSAMLWHYSAGNRTAGTRRAFIVSYQEATILKGNKRQYCILRPA